MMRYVIAAILITLAAPQSSSSYRAEIAKHREARVAELTAPNGWLAVQGLFWLHEGENTAGSDPSAEIKLPARAAKRVGVFTLTNGKVTFAADPAAHVEVAGKHAAGPVELGAGERNAVVSSRLSLFLLRRGDRIGLRLLDPDSHARRTFPGLRYFPLDPAYRFNARFTAYPAMKTVTVLNVLGQLVPMESPGYVEFTLGGRTWRLEPVYETPRHEDLFFIFKDLTSRTDTYEAGRYLHTPLPRDGIVDLDFNRAYNPPCAFTAFATCPLPTRDNQLAVAIRAGELRHHEAPSKPR
jgi:uncharacterized protein (DUF1684 family)